MIEELPSSGIYQEITTFEPETLVTGALGLFGMTAAITLSSPDKDEKPTEFLAYTLNL